MNQPPPTPRLTRAEWPPNGDLSLWIASHFPKDYRGWCVDCGASDGISVNSSYVLEKDLKWTVLSIEPNPIFWPKLTEIRAFVAKCACDKEEGVAQFHSWGDNPEAYSALRPTYPDDCPADDPKWTRFMTPVRTLEQLLKIWAFPQLDALTIDVEGNEMDVLNGLDLAKWSPKVVVVEAWTEGSLDEYLGEFGYARKWRTAHNDCYVLEKE